MTLSEVASSLGASPCQNEMSVSGVAIDSRAVKKGNLFFCLPGERVDGHEFAARAVENGAAGIVASRPLAGMPVPVIEVPDTALALGSLAKSWRIRISARVICVTGTAGKTTLKEILGAVLAEAGKCCATSGNHNNQIGLPLTVLESEGDEDWLLLEAGISHEGDMDYLGEISQPDLALILNVGPGHTDGLGVLGVAWHKTRILQFLAPGGFGLINADYKDLAREAEKFGVPLKWFGSSLADVDFGPARLLEEAVEINEAGERRVYEIPVQSPNLAETLLAAVSAARVLGIEPEIIQRGLWKAAQPAHRYQMQRYADHFVIDDSYNANPLSMERSLRVAKNQALSSGLPFVAVLGEMGELGEEAPLAHTRLGLLLRELSPAAVFWKGQWLAEVESAYGGEIFSLSDEEQFPGLWQDGGLPKRTLTIFKGSRSNHLETYLARLQESGIFRRERDVL